MIPDGNLNPHKGMKSNRSSNYLEKHIKLFSYNSLKGKRVNQYLAPNKVKFSV